MSQHAFVPESLRGLLAQADPQRRKPLEALLNADQRRRWTRGERLPIEVYRTVLPDLDDELLLDLIYSEIVLREDLGETPTLEDYSRRFPELGPRLERLFAVHGELAGSLDGLFRMLDEARPETTLAHIPEPQPSIDRPTPPPITPNTGSGSAPSVVRSSPPEPTVPGYKILGRLGQGGMGVVYKARHLRLGRVVALKMILSGAHAESTELVRFLGEAEAVAKLHHPNVVQLYETGQHDGLPYFTLEFVSGGSLADKLRGTPLPPREAAQLLVAIARGAQHAHDCGVIHRDLKPANLLLDADGTPKITDFGLAKRVEVCGMTASWSVLGTPSYMAPEQAGGRSRVVDHRADVYSLGAILYEVLTGRPPLKAATPVETVLQVLEDDPAPPRLLQPKIPRDLETICLKCLRKEPARRYATAAALADDLARFLDGAPILARSVGPVERAWRWARRRPLLAGLGSTIALLLLALVVGSWVAVVQVSVARDEERLARKNAQHRAEQEAAARERAEEAEQQARSETRKAQKMSEVLVGMFQASDPLAFNGSMLFTPGDAGRKLTADVILDRGAERVRREFQDEPLLRAALYESIGDVYRTLGEFRKAEPMLREAVELRRAAGREDLELAASLHALGWLRHDLGDYEQAEKLYREAIAIRERLAGPESLLVLASKFNLAMLLAHANDHDASDTLFREVLELRRRLLGPKHRDVGVTLLALAMVLSEKGDNREAEKLGLEGIEIFRLQPGAERLANAVGEFVRGLVTRRTGFPKLAEPMFRKCLELTRSELGQGHFYTALILHELAVTVDEAGRPDEAEALFRESLEVGRSTVGLEHPRALVGVESFARFLEKRGKANEIAPLFDEILTARRKRYGPDHPLVAETLFAYTRHVEKESRERAEAMYREADRIYRKTGGVKRTDNAFNLNNWAVLLESMGRLNEAEPLYRESLVLHRRLGMTPRDTITVIHNLADLLLNRRQFDEAVPLLREGLTLCRTSRLDADTALDLREKLAKCELELRHPAAALPLVVELLTEARKTYAKQPNLLLPRVETTANLLALLGRFTESAERYDEAAELARRAKRNTSIVRGLIRDAALARLAAGDLEGYGETLTRLVPR